MAQLSLRFVEEQPRRIEHLRVPAFTFHQEYPADYAPEELLPYQGNDTANAALYTERMRVYLLHGRVVNEQYRRNIAAYGMPNADLDRGSGRTIRQLWRLGSGGLFLVRTRAMARHVREVADHLGRSDIHMHTLDGLLFGSLRGRRFRTADFDHAVIIGMTRAEEDEFHTHWTDFINTSLLI